MAKRKFLLLNGPNLDMLGIREPEVYGRDTLESLEEAVSAYAAERGVKLACEQSNSEGKLIRTIHKAFGKYDGVVFNPGAFTHYSYAIRDAIGAIDVPVVEVHLSDIETREAFRQVSVVAPACVAQVKGLGVESYCRAIDVLLDNEDLPRLGEEFEERFDMASHIIVSTEDAAWSPIEGEPDAAGETDGAFGFEGDAEATLEDSGEAEAECAFAEPEAELECADPEPEPEPEPAIPDISPVELGVLSVKRQDSLRAALAQIGVDAMLVRDTPNIRYLTAFDGVFDGERAHALVIADDCASLHTDSRYSNAAHDAAVTTGSNVIIDEGRVSHFEFARQELAPGVDGAFTGKLGFEDSITYAEFVKAASVFGTGSLVPTKDLVLTLRSVKDETELSLIRAAQAVADAAFRHIIGFMRPGMTEREVQLELDDFMLRHGADALSFPTIVACGENGADPHAQPTDKRLEAGQCVVIDFGAKVRGYHSDTTRTVFLGEPDGKMAAAWEAMRAANEAAELFLRPGVTGIEVHETAERTLAEFGFGGRMGHGLGHGVGLECHELPNLNTRNDKPLRAGNVVTVEPGIYFPGEFGMRLEDCGVITETGYDVFTRLGHEPFVI